MTQLDRPSDKAVVFYTFYPQDRVHTEFPPRRTLNLTNLIGCLNQVSERPPDPDTYDFALGIADYHKDIRLTHSEQAGQVALNNCNVSGWSSNVGFGTCATTMIKHDSNEVDIIATKRSLCVASIALSLAMAKLHNDPSPHDSFASGSFPIRTGEPFGKVVQEIVPCYDVVISRCATTALGLELRMSFEQARNALRELEIL